MKQFPIQDQHWVSAANFVEAHIQPEETVLASRPFKDRLENVCPYSVKLQNARKFDWAIVHKGRLKEINLPLLESIQQELHPVFADEVFVVFSKQQNLPRLNSNSHLGALNSKRFRFNLMGWEVDLSIKPKPIATPEAKHFANPKPADVVPLKEIAPDYATLATHEIKDLMEQRFSSGNAYPSDCLWDDVRGSDLNRQVYEIIVPTAGKSILEIGCGIGSTASLVADCEQYIGTDLSETAIEQASQSYKDCPNFKFVAMNAEKLDFPDCEFDLFIAKEVIEHIPDAEASLREAFRVLKPGGKLVITSPNRDSLHLRINRKLGKPDFKCSIDHVKEFTFQEAVEMVQRQRFSIEHTGGIFLTPYWGLPRIHPQLRGLTDHDPEVIEIMRDLGTRVGGEYAFCFIIAAIKPS